VAVVQRQLDAYNARDLAGLLATYAPEACIYEHPATLLATGTDALRERYGARFREPNLHATLVNRIATGRFVIDHERVTRTFPEGPGEVEVAMIYEVKDGKIVNAWSVPGRKTIFGQA